jgi:hypothetical protein
MKQLLTFALFLLTMTAGAQDPVLIEDGFQANCTMNIFWESDDPDDMADADKDAKWHIEKQDGCITFWIDLPQVKQLSKTQWKNAALTMTVINGMKTYIVSDHQFRHLAILEFEKNKYIVHLYSILVR